MVLFITGAVNSGKTTLMRRLACALAEHGRKPAGLLAEKEFNGDKRTYYAADAFSGRRKKLLEVLKRRIKEAPGGFAFAAKALGRSPASGIMIVDEFGPLEISGKGHFKAVKRVLDKDMLVMIVLRNGILKAAAKALSLEKYARIPWRGRSAEKKILNFALAYAKRP